MSTKAASTDTTSSFSPQAGASGVVAIYNDPRIEGLTIPELVGLYEALTSAAEVLGSRTQDGRLYGKDGEDVLTAFEEHIYILAGKVIDVLRERKPTGGCERLNRNTALLRCDLLRGESMLRIAQTALALAAEDKGH